MRHCHLERCISIYRSQLEFLNPNGVHLWPTLVDAPTQRRRSRNGSATGPPQKTRNAKPQNKIRISENENCFPQNPHFFIQKQLFFIWVQSVQRIIFHVSSNIMNRWGMIHHLTAQRFPPGMGLYCLNKNYLGALI